MRIWSRRWADLGIFVPRKRRMGHGDLSEKQVFTCRFMSVRCLIRGRLWTKQRRNGDYNENKVYEDAGLRE